MTKRVQLILKVRNFLERELLQHVATWDYVKMQKQMHTIEQLGQRLPKVLVPQPKISSQRKLSF